MKEPFLRQKVPGIGPEGCFIPVANPEAEWFFSEPSIATREYQGHLMRQTDTGWQYWQPRYWKTIDNESKMLVPGNWQPVYPRVSYFRQALQVLSNTWRDRNSPYKYVQEFEDAESPFTDEYEVGEYWLVEDKSWFLVPVNKAEQLSNINEVGIHEIGNVEEIFESLQNALAPLRNNIYGVIFTGRDGRRVRVRPNDFDWTQYDA